MKKIRTKRRKNLEYKWILKGALIVQPYGVKLENNKTYVVYAHDFNDAELFLSLIEMFELSDVKYRDADLGKKKMLIPLDKNGEPKTMPFWYRGRVYEIIEQGENK